MMIPHTHRNTIMVSLLKNLTSHQTVSITAHPGYDVVTSVVKLTPDIVPRDSPAWTKMSVGKRMYGQKAGYPYEETLISLKADEAKMYKHILDNYDFETGLSTINTQNMTASEKVSLSNGYKGLHKRNLVKRVKKFTYLINPDARWHKNMYDNLLKLWQSLP